MGTGWWATGRSLRAFGQDRRGNVAMLWGLMAAVLLGILGIAVDFTRAQMIHTQLQNAADGAALAAARGVGLPLSQRQQAALAFFNAEAGDYAAQSHFTLTPLADGTYQTSATAPMPMSLAALVSNQPWNIAVTSQAQQNGVNLEVSLVLDTTGSMAGQKIIDMRSAATSLVTTVVRAQQTPFYSKLAVIPFSNGVDVGSYAAAARGPVTAGTSITAADWRSGAAAPITAATRGSGSNRSTVTITAVNTLHNGDSVWITGVKGMTELNNARWTVSNASLVGFTVTGVSGTSTFTLLGGGTAQKCATTACEVVVTSNNHGLANGDYVYILNVSGMTQINSTANTAWQVSNAGSMLTANTFVLSGTNGPTYSAYTRGGTAYCVKAGCQYYRFTNRSGSIRVYGITTCVSDRTGANAYTDVAPATTYVGRNYSVGGDQCSVSGQIMPLTTDTTALNARINALTAAGSTAGHIGTAWGWYMLSPNFASLWPAASQPAAYGAPNTMKVMVLMTDGAYNLAYCNGVESDGGSNSSMINCSSPNGDSPTQAAALCTAMKQAGVIIYTVGFDLGSDTASLNRLQTCASDAAHFYRADNGADLQSAFQDIANQITQLRISH